MRHPRSAEFAAALQAFLRTAIGPQLTLATADLGDGLRVGPGPLTSSKFRLVELAPDCPGPLLKVEYKLADDSSGAFCRVLESTFGLFVPRDSASKGADTVPVIRLEYVAQQDPPAHVHFHTSSQPLGWIYGSAGGFYRRSEELHFPVGSKRFRPTIEDFLLFLDRERIFRGWRGEADWRAVALERRAEYERRQAIATVHYHPEDIAAELTRLGWNVQPPAQ